MRDRFRLEKRESRSCGALRAEASGHNDHLSTRWQEVISLVGIGTSLSKDMVRSIFGSGVASAAVVD